MWSFFTQFRDVIFKCNGSVIPKCWLEVSICTFLGIVARLLFADPEQHFYLDVWSPVGHQLVGVLLAFLTVFRSQIAWSMYLQGYNGVTSLQTSMINFTHVTLSPMAAKCQANGGEPLPREAHELIRLLKLCYFLCVEHLRSSEGTEAWGWAQFVAYSFALPREIIHFEAEYGILQYGDQRADVCRVEPDNGDNAIISKTGAMLNTLEWLKRRRACGVQNIDSALELRDKAPPPVPLLRASEHGKGGETQYRTMEKTCDPTKSKVLTSISWLHSLVATIERRKHFPGGADPGGYMKMGGISQLNAINASFQTLHKVDQIVLPLPYNQLLKLMLLGWNFTLPFVIAADVGWFNPMLMFLISSAFFGLDQVGVMLEQPFGVDSPDISLLSIGEQLSDDLDAVLRAADATAQINLDKADAPFVKQLDGSDDQGRDFKATPSTAASMSTLHQQVDDEDDDGVVGGGEGDAGGGGGGGDDDDGGDV